MRIVAASVSLKRILVRWARATNSLGEERPRWKRLGRKRNPATSGAVWSSTWTDAVAEAATPAGSVTVTVPSAFPRWRTRA